MQQDDSNNDDKAREKACECIICTERFARVPMTRVPRALPCGHSFCTGCLTQQLQVTNPLRCGLCRTGTATTLSSMPVNLALLECVENPEMVRVRWMKPVLGHDAFFLPLLDQDVPLSTLPLGVQCELFLKHVADENVKAVRTILADHIYPQLTNASTEEKTEVVVKLSRALRLAYELMAGDREILFYIMNCFWVMSKIPALRNDLTSSVPVILRCIQRETAFQQQRNAIKAGQPIPHLPVHPLPDPVGGLTGTLAAIMAFLACAYSARAKIIAEDGIAILLDFVRVYGDDNTTCIGVMSAYADMCVSKPYQLRIAEVGALTEVLGFIRLRLPAEKTEDSKDPVSTAACDTQQNCGGANFDVVRACCRVLVNTAIAPENKVRLRDLDAIRTLFRVLEAHMDNAKITFLVTSALCNLTALLSTCALVAKEEKGVALLAKALRQYKDDVLITESTTGTFCNLSSDEKCVEAMEKEDVFEALWYSICKFPTHLKIAEGVFGAVATYARKPERVAKVRKFTAHLETASRTFVRAPNVLGRAQTALARFEAAPPAMNP